MLRQQYMEKLAGWRADRLILWMNQLQMSLQVIESLGGRQKGLHLMNIDYSTVLNVGLNILPAYTVDGFITWEVLQGSFTMELCEEFIEFNVLP